MNEQAIEKLHALLHLLVANQALLLLTDAQDPGRWTAARRQLLEQFEQFERALEQS